MTEFKKTLVMPQGKKDFFHKFGELNGEESANLGEHYDNIYTCSIGFDNGYIAEIQMVIADYDNPNWSMATLYDNDGNNISECYGETGSIFGEWYLPVGNDTFTVIVED